MSPRAAKVLLTTFLLGWLAALGVSAYACQLAFTRRTSLHNAMEESAKPYRFHFRVAFAAIISVGGLSLMAFASLRGREALAEAMDVLNE